MSHRRRLWTLLAILGALASSLLAGCGESDRRSPSSAFPAGTWIADLDVARARLAEVVGSDRAPSHKAALEELLTKWINREIKYIVQADGTGRVRVLGNDGKWNDVLQIQLEPLDRPGEWKASYFLGSELKSNSTADWRLLGSRLTVRMLSVEGRVTDLTLVLDDR